MNETKREYDLRNPKITIRVTPQEREAIKAEAGKLGMTMGEYIATSHRNPNRNPTPVAGQVKDDLEFLLKLFQRNAPLRDFTAGDLERVKQILARVKGTT